MFGCRVLLWFCGTIHFKGNFEMWQLVFFHDGSKCRTRVDPDFSQRTIDQSDTHAEPSQSLNQGVRTLIFDDTHYHVWSHCLTDDQHELMVNFHVVGSERSTYIVCLEWRGCRLVDNRWWWTSASIDIIYDVKIRCRWLKAILQWLDVGWWCICGMVTMGHCDVQRKNCTWKWWRDWDGGETA